MKINYEALASPDEIVVLETTSPEIALALTGTNALAINPRSRLARLSVSYCPILAPEWPGISYGVWNPVCKGVTVRVVGQREVQKMVDEPGGLQLPARTSLMLRSHHWVPRIADLVCGLDALQTMGQGLDFKGHDDLEFAAASVPWLREGRIGELAVRVTLRGMMESSGMEPDELDATIGRMLACDQADLPGMDVLAGIFGPAMADMHLLITGRAWNPPRDVSAWRKRV